MYICGMKENYNHENRHKYYLKCHLIFCIKYRRKIVRKLKQESTVFSWRLYDSMLRKYFWKDKTLWSDGYFVCSIGEANPNTVIECIRNQG